ncbi:hypothetical protein FQZ97_782400 [compost metagenome]
MPTWLQQSGLIAAAAIFSVKPNAISAASWAAGVLFLRIAWLAAFIRVWSCSSRCTCACNLAMASGSSLEIPPVPTAAALLS